MSTLTSKLLDNSQLGNEDLTNTENLPWNPLSNQTQTTTNSQMLAREYLWKKLRLANSSTHLITNYETNITFCDYEYEIENRLNTSTLADYIELETIAFKKSQTEFDWINNTNPFERIYNLRDLPKNWDNYGASSFPEEQIERATQVYVQFLLWSFSYPEKLLDIQPFVAPCSDGTILLEWAGNRFPLRQLELYIPRDLKSNLQYLKSSATLEEEAEISENELSILFGWLFEKTR